MQEERYLNPPTRPSLKDMDKPEEDFPQQNGKATIANRFATHYDDIDKRDVSNVDVDRIGTAFDELMDLLAPLTEYQREQILGSELLWPDNLEDMELFINEKFLATYRIKQQITEEETQRTQSLPYVTRKESTTGERLGHRYAPNIERLDAWYYLLEAESFNRFSREDVASINRKYDRLVALLLQLRDTEQVDVIDRTFKQQPTKDFDAVDVIAYLDDLLARAQSRVNRKDDVERRKEAGKNEQAAAMFQAAEKEVNKLNETQRKELERLLKERFGGVEPATRDERMRYFRLAVIEAHKLLHPPKKWDAVLSEREVEQQRATLKQKAQDAYYKRRLEHADYDWHRRMLYGEVKPRVTGSHIAGVGSFW
jgi:hypothetical protein